MPFQQVMLVNTYNVNPRVKFRLATTLIPTTKIDTFKRNRNLPNTDEKETAGQVLDGEFLLMMSSRDSSVLSMPLDNLKLRTDSVVSFNQLIILSQAHWFYLIVDLGICRSWFRVSKSPSQVDDSSTCCSDGRQDHDNL